jgi:hypothetical protein
MTVGMPSKTTAAKAGVKGATKVVRSRATRRAAKAGVKGGTKVVRSRTTRRAAKPAARATWFVGKKVVKRKAKKRARSYGDAAGTAWSAATIYVPLAAEALGLVEQPKPRRRAPAFLAGVAVGAGLMYVARRDRTT